MNIKTKISFFFILANILSFAAHSMEVFKEGEEFRRTKSNSPVFLRYSSKITVTNYGLNLKRAGFEICTYNTNPAKREAVGYAIYEIRKDENTVEISWVKVNEDKQNAGYATEALQTLISLIKKKRESHFSNMSHCFLTIAKSKPAMKRVVEKLGFEESNLLFCPPEFNNFILSLDSCPADEKTP